MQIHLERIVSANNPKLDLLLALYRESFPPEERRDEQQLRGLAGLPEMHFSAILNKEELLGFIILWDFGTFGFVEHFAIYPQFRRKNVGTEVLHLITGKLPKLLLESEKNHDEISEKRIRFYTRNGFHILDINYFQPPYREGEDLLPMYLLSDSQNWEEHELKVAVKLFQDKVYFRYH